MPLIVRAATIHDEGQIAQLLARVFSVEQHEPFLDLPLLRWKYWQPRADCPDPRSFVIEKDGRIVAHLGLWPVTVQIGAKQERGFHGIDWASDPRPPGSGLLLLQHLAETYDFVYSIGGTETAQSILPKFGFRVVTETLTWARPIRPWRQMLSHQSRGVRLPLRLARNIWWSRMPLRTVPRGWTALELGPDGAEEFATFSGERDAPFFRYLQQCPQSPCLTFQLIHNGRPAGFFALTVVQGQARLAGVWLESPSVETYLAALHLAQDAALQRTGASELVFRCSPGASSDAAQRAGMRLRARVPVLVFRKDSSAESLPLQFHLCDNDALFLRERRAGFLT